MLMGLTLTVLMFGCSKPNSQADCEKEQTKKWDAQNSKCVDRVYFTFTLRGDADGNWQTGVVARITAGHTTNTLDQVGDCVKVEDTLFTNSPPMIEFMSNGATHNVASGLTPGHYDITAEAGGAHGFGTAAVEAMNTEKNCVPINEDVQHLTVAPADGTTPAPTEATPAPTEATPAPAGN